jgi:hypothetical protein
MVDQLNYTWLQQGFVLADKVRREHAKDTAATQALLAELMKVAQAYDLSAMRPV